MQTRLIPLLVVVTWVGPVCSQLASADDPLPSWNAGAAKTAIVDFVARATNEGTSDFVPIPERIATFDNDGTLWCEKPNYVQAEFLISRVRALAAEHPEWKDREPFASLLKEDMRAALAGGEQGIADLVTSTHAGMTPDEFAKIVTDWLATARHPRFHHLYTECVYQPMLELLAYLRANEFKTFIVTGGGIDFVRTYSARVYGIPPEQVVGSSIKAKFVERDGTFEILRLPEIGFIDDGPGKPLGIQQFIGRRPHAAFGNSDGDLQMLQWTTAGSAPRFGLIVHHTDAEREYAYDRDSTVGHLDVALKQAGPRGWTVVNMKKDWKVIFPFDKPAQD